MDSSDDSLPDWVLEHASPRLQSQPEHHSDTSPESEQIENTQLSNHERRPEGPSKPEADAATSAEQAVRSSLVVASDLPGQTPLLLPDKLSTSRCLVEVLDSASTDLAGDAGAVGRFGVVQHGQQQQAQLDLKGAIYAMTVVPCASTLCVVNIRQTDAKVEAVLSEFIQLGQEVGQGSAQDDKTMFLFADDDETYQEQSLPGTASARDEAAPKKAASKKKAAQKLPGRKQKPASGVSKKALPQKARRGT